MKLEVGLVHTQAHPSSYELTGLVDSLTLPDIDPVEGSGMITHFLSDDMRFYSGLLPIVTKQFSPEDLELIYTYEESSVKDVDHSDDKVRIDFDQVGSHPDKALISIDMLSGIELRDYQVQAIANCLIHKRGVVSAPPSSGKTEMMAAIIKTLDLPSVTLEHRVLHAQQTAERFESRGVSDVSVVSGDSDGDLSAKHIVCASQTLYAKIKRHEEYRDMLSSRRILLIDESHHTGAHSWSVIASMCENAEYRLGFSATPFTDPVDKNSPEDMTMLGLLGDVVFYIPISYLFDLGYISRPIVTFIPIVHGGTNSFHWSKVYRDCIVRNRRRNSAVVKVAKHFYDLDEKVLVLVTQHTHGRNLVGQLYDLDAGNTIFSRGGGSVDLLLRDPSNCPFWEEQQWSYHDVVSWVNGEGGRVLVGTTIYDEAVDLPVLQVVILAGGMGSDARAHRKTVQRIGRSLRKPVDDLSDHHVHIFDFWDNQHNFTIKHSRNRYEVCVSEGMEVHEGLNYVNSILDPPIGLLAS